MKSLGKITKGKGKAQQQQDQNMFHAQTSIPKGNGKSILWWLVLRTLCLVLSAERALKVQRTKYQEQSWAWAVVVLSYLPSLLKHPPVK